MAKTKLLKCKTELVWRNAVVWDMENASEIEVIGTIHPLKGKVKLFRCLGLWWIHYGLKKNTGPFISKEEAEKFYEGGGR